MKKVRKVKAVQRPDNEKKLPLHEPEDYPAGVDAKRIRSCSSLAHLSEAEAEEFAAFLRLYCEAVFRIVEREDEEKNGSGASFDWEDKNAA